MLSIFISYFNVFKILLFYRWKKMEQHDVVMECTRYTLLENGDRNYQNPSTWTNAGSNFSSALGNL